MAYNTICLGGFDFALSEEQPAGESGIYPGMFLEYDASLQFIRQNESEVPGMMIIADVDPMRPASAGSNTTMQITDAYTSGDRVKARWVPLGAKFYAYLAPGHNATKGTSYLSFAGTEAPGALGVAEYDSADKGVGAYFKALESVNNSAGVANARILVQRVR